MTSPAAPTAPELPIGAAEYHAAQQGTQQRGTRIMTALAGLAALSAVGAAGLVAGMYWAFQAMPGWLKQLSELDSTSSPTLPDFTALPTWLPATLAALILLGAALQVWATLVARQVIGAARDYAINPQNDTVQALQDGARVVRPWITLGQYAPLLSAAFSMLVSAGSLLWANQLAPQADKSVAPFGVGFALLSTLLQSLPGIIITWLILAAIRRLLDGLVARSQGHSVMLRPLARQVDPWLLFTLILLILGLLGTIFTALMFLFFPALINLIMQSEAPTPEISGLLHPMQNLFGALAVLMLLGTLVYGLLAALMAWSRGFALNAATTLDAALPSNTPETAPAPYDPWTGEVQQATSRPPR